MHCITRPPIIYRYITREIVTPFILSLFVFTGVLFLARSLKLIDLVINRNVPAGDIILLFSYIVPRFLEIAMPMSLLLAIILAFGRLSSDSELVVMRATGLSLKRLSLPVFFFALFVLVTTLVTGFWIRPWADHRLGLGMFEIARTQASAGLTPGTFNALGQLTIYAESVETNGKQLNNVIIGDRRDVNKPRTFIARYGKVLSDKKRRTLTLQLYDGTIEEGAGQDLTVTYFEINSVRLPQTELVEEAPSRSGKKSGEMYIGELLEAAAAKTGEKWENSRYAVELHRRIAIPFSCLCIAFIAMALGIQPSRGGHTWGPATNAGVGIFLILVYYVMLAFAAAIGEQTRNFVWLIVWTPNLLFAALGFYFFKRMGSEQWLAVTQALGDKLKMIVERTKIAGWLAAR